MKYPNTKSETFFRNLLKHSIKQNEWKVLIAFIVDHPTEYHITLPEFVKRTGINKPNVSRALRGLMNMGILTKDKSNNYILTEEILNEEYEPNNYSTTQMRIDEEASNIPGNGDFAKQAKIKKQKLKIAEHNVKKMITETQKKKQNKEWTKFYSDLRKKEIYLKTENYGNRKILYYRDKLESGIQAWAPKDLIIEYFNNVLNIFDPEEIVKFMHPNDAEDYIIENNLKRAD